MISQAEVIRSFQLDVHLSSTHSFSIRSSTHLWSSDGSIGLISDGGVGGVNLIDCTRRSRHGRQRANEQAHGGPHVLRSRP